MSLMDQKLSRRSLTKTTAAVTAKAAITFPAANAVMAQDAATPVGDEAPPAQTGGLPPLPEGATLVAEGLFNPRFLAIGSDGTLYVSEVGVGGDEVIEQPESGTGEVDGATPVTESATPVTGDPVPQATPEEPAAPLSTRGYTGQISTVGDDGVPTVIVEGLPSYSDGVGVHGIALGAGEVYYAIGGAGVGLGIDPLPEENTVNRLVLDTGETSLIADLGAYEVENNPDGTDVNPNLYMIEHAPEGQLIVADAGANALYFVDIASGEFELATVLPSYSDLTGEELDPDLGSGQFIPTSISVGPDGTRYVAPLREFWPPDSPSVLILADDETLTPVEQEDPLNWTVAMVAGPDGLLYASQLFTFSPDSPEPGPGRVVRITADGTVENVVESVMMPHGLVFDDEGNLYVAINTLMSGPGAPAGQVIRVDGVANVEPIG